MNVISDFNFTFSAEEQVCFDWFCKTYIKKMADSEFKICMERIYERWQHQLIEESHRSEIIKEF